MKITENTNVPEYCANLLKEAAELGASDIYILPGAAETEIRLRINGVQKDFARIPAEFASRCIARIKVMADMLTYRNSIAQDGAIRQDGVEFRVASMPVLNGERVTIRLFNREQKHELLDDLGFQPAMAAGLKKLLECPSGLIILTGPTGCGKTTTIYAMIRELLKHKQDPASIIAIEDPTECEINGISQVSLPRDNAEWNYAMALRAALRHDVKTLVIGEMRDPAIVKVALDAALTGHRIITTYHAGDIPSIFARLLHQGFEPFLVAAAVSGVVAQRLVHNFSGDCRIPVAAILQMDYAWRDFLSAGPSAAAIRERIAGTLGADIAAVAEELAAKQIISKVEALLI